MVFDITIGINGTVTRTRVVQSSGVAVLDAAAEQAVKQWEYAPTVTDGVARAVILTVSVRFPPQ